MSAGKGEELEGQAAIIDEELNRALTRCLERGVRAEMFLGGLAVYAAECVVATPEPRVLADMFVDHLRNVLEEGLERLKYASGGERGGRKGEDA